MRCLFPVLLVLLYPILSIAPTAQADLISLHDSVFGTDSVTLDTSTGLQWLDLNKSRSRRFDTVIAQSGIGGQFEGWRHATRAEIENLFYVSAAIPIGQHSPANQALVELMNLLSSQSRQFVGRVIFSSGFFDDSATGTDVHRVGYAELERFSQRIGNHFVRTSSSEIRDDWILRDHSSGAHWLVRAVPEPTSNIIWLLAICLSSTRIRREKKSSRIQ